MKKKNKKKKEIVKHEDCGHDEDKLNSVYMFHHIKHDLHLFINAHYLDGAMEKFDQCNFQDRKNWRIFLECGQQPA